MDPIRQMQYIEVGIADECYALRISDVHEIIKLQTITKLYTDNSYVKGIIHLRGHIIPVICLRSRMGMPEGHASKSSRIVVVKHTEGLVGIVVDCVTKVSTYSEIKLPTETVGGRGYGLLEGIAAAPDSLVGILNLDQVLLRDGYAAESK